MYKDEWPQSDNNTLAIPLATNCSMERCLNMCKHARVKRGLLIPLGILRMIKENLDASIHDESPVIASVIT